MITTYEKFVSDISKKIYVERDEYLKSKIKNIWQKPILRKFLKFGLYVEETPYKVEVKNLPGCVAITQMYELKAKNIFYKKLFLKCE